MEANFEYFYTQQAVGQLNIEDLGNCAIEAFNDEGSHYYLVIKTQLGQSIVMEAGPFAIDIPILEKSVSVTYKRIEYNESKLKGIIEKFLNNPYRKITQAQEIEENDVYDNCINILDYVKENKDFN